MGQVFTIPHSSFLIHNCFSLTVIMIFDTIAAKALKGDFIMEIRKVSEGSAMTLYISGRLDAVTALELDKEISPELNPVTDLTVDLADLEYISSAGLRLLLKIQKRMDKQGAMRIRNIREGVREVLDMTGFSDFLTIADDKKAKFSVSF